MELTEFVSTFKERLDAIKFDAESIWNGAIVARCLSPEEAAEALIEFCQQNTQVDLDLYRGTQQVINRFWLSPPGPKITNMGPGRFIILMFVLGITIE